MPNGTGLEFKLQEMAQRIRTLREIVGLTPEEMARKTGVSTQEYLECEAGRQDLNFAFLYRCALSLNVDVTDIIEGTSPRLAGYTVTRRGEGQQIQKAHGMTYFNLASAFKNRIAEPLYVVSEYDEKAQNGDIELTSHDGQECDVVVSGALKVQVGDHVEILHAGDSIYYDSSIPHGMIAVENGDCRFYAFVLNPNSEPMDKIVHGGVRDFVPAVARKKPAEVSRVWESFVCPMEDAKGRLTGISFQNEDRFNFAFDVVDKLAEEKPDKLAMVHIGADKTERRFTFLDLKQASNQTANYFKSLGIRKGDRVMLILKRHYQFWFAMLALHKLGAVAIPATNQLKEHDMTYRLNKAGVKMVLCTADDMVPQEMDKAAVHAPSLQTKILVGGSREGWHNFDEEYSLYTRKLHRPEDAACGEDLMLMYFTSGTTGNPKIAMHNYKYPLGHFITAKYWHCVNPDGLHLTIADTGWAKAAWGKLYGQWLCEAAIFVYDFDRFDANDILPMFRTYGITTFCAPPTILRMMIKQDLSRFDLSSIEHMTTAGEALNPEVFRQFEKATGLQIMEGFGQSETTVALANLAGSKARLGSMGKPVPLYAIRLVNPEGEDVSVGEVGEIVFDISQGNPCGLFTGYYEDAEKTAECRCNGLYHTGDTAWRDEDGYFWYVGRVDDVIKSSGYRIGPFEIENVIMELPYVLECGVSAMPDEVRGQVVKASIVLVSGTEGSDALKKEIQEYVKKRTAPYKYPRVVIFRDELPKTASGKIQRNKLSRWENEAMKYDISVTKTTCPKVRPTDESKLGFGKVFTDHMFLMDYAADKGWYNGRIVPFGPIAIHPAATVLHYGAEIFEGMKAYRAADNTIRLFRPMENIRRLNQSAERLCLPQLDEEGTLEILKTMVELEKDWVPHSDGTSLYIRPYLFGNDPHLGVHAVKEATFVVICSAVGAYYAEGINPVKIAIEAQDVRAVRGGTGYAKCGGNYAASLRAGQKAEEQGYTQVLWLDGVERKYIEEVGAMNVMFKIGGKIVTPALSGSILPGITRKSCIELLRDWGYQVEERQISVEELFAAAADGSLEEAWGTGTAAVVSPIGQLFYMGTAYTLCNNEIGPVAQKLYDNLTGIQWGRLEDKHNWSVVVCDG